MKLLKILLAVFVSCVIFAGCKPGGQGKESRLITIEVTVEGLPVTDAAAKVAAAGLDEGPASDEATAPDEDAPEDASETLENRDGAISRALTDSAAVYAKVFYTATRALAVAAVQLDPPDATHTGYHKTLTLPASGAFTILAYAENASGNQLYSGTGTVTVTNDVANPAALSITVHGSSDPASSAAYTVGDWGPNGGTIIAVFDNYASRTVTVTNISVPPLTGLAALLYTFFYPINVSGTFRYIEINPSVTRSWWGSVVYYDILAVL